MKPQEINTTVKRGEKEEERVGWLVGFKFEINSSIRADFKGLKEGGRQPKLCRTLSADLR